MDDFGINEMLEMQKALQDKYKDIWEKISPEIGQNKRYGISTEELKQSYVSKFEKNMKRW